MSSDDGVRRWGILPVWDGLFFDNIEGLLPAGHKVIAERRGAENSVRELLVEGPDMPVVENGEVKRVLLLIEESFDEVTQQRTTRGLWSHMPKDRPALPSAVWPALLSSAIRDPGHSHGVLFGMERVVADDGSAYGVDISSHC